VRQIKILKNVTTEEITVFGFVIPVGGEQELSPNLFLKMTYEESVLNLVSSGALVVNNGSEDLSAIDGVAYLQTLSSAQSDDGFSWRHIPSGNKVTIRSGRQMISYFELEIDSGGEIVLEDGAEGVLID